ncbi:MAG1430 family protein [Mycoplasma sp. 4079]|uniref:MAG1430 family protein n=1 Tax=Mycoplasma sp. 4079 TaxID=3398615 RepID=UPI0039FD797D
MKLTKQTLKPLLLLGGSVVVLGGIAATSVLLVKQSKKKTNIDYADFNLNVTGSLTKDKHLASEYATNPLVPISGTRWDNSAWIKELTVAKFQTESDKNQVDNIKSFELTASNGVVFNAIAQEAKDQGFRIEFVSYANDLTGTLLLKMLVKDKNANTVKTHIFELTGFATLTTKNPYANLTIATLTADTEKLFKEFKSSDALKTHFEALEQDKKVEFIKNHFSTKESSKLTDFNWSSLQVTFEDKIMKLSISYNLNVLAGTKENLSAQSVFNLEENNKVDTTVDLSFLDAVRPTIENYSLVSTGSLDKSTHLASEFASSPILQIGDTNWNKDKWLAELKTQNVMTSEQAAKTDTGKSFTFVYKDNATTENIFYTMSNIEFTSYANDETGTLYLQFKKLNSENEAAEQYVYELTGFATVAADNKYSTLITKSLTLSEEKLKANYSSIQALNDYVTTLNEETKPEFIKANFDLQVNDLVAIDWAQSTITMTDNTLNVHLVFNQNILKATKDDLTAKSIFALTSDNTIELSQDVSFLNQQA